MRKAILTILQYVIFLGLGIGIVYYMLHELSDKQQTELVNAIKSIDAWYLIPIGIAGFLSHFFRAVRWRYLLKTLDMSPTIPNTTFAVMIGYIVNLVLPRAGEVAKCTVLAKYEKMPAHKMIGTILAERAFDVFCLIIIAISAFLLQIQVISEYVSGLIHILKYDIRLHEKVLFAVLIAITLVIIAIVMFYRRHRETKFGHIVTEMSHAIFSIFRMKNRWKFIGYTVLIWLMYLMQLYIGLKSLPNTHHLSILTALVVLVYGSIGMIITPGGIGLYTLLVAQILMTVYRIPDVPAQAFGWIAWAVQTGLIIILGVLSLLFIHPYNRKRDAKVAMGNAENI